MHSGGAQTTLKNNRKLLKKRMTTKQRYKRIISLHDSQYQKTPNPNLITLSASERRRYSYAVRHKNRLEFTLIMLLVVGALLYFGYQLSEEEVVAQDSELITKKFTTSNIPVLEYQVERELTAQERLEQNFKAYIDFGDYFVADKQYSRAIAMYKKALEYKPESIETKQLIKDTYADFELNKKVISANRLEIHPE